MFLMLRRTNGSSQILLRSKDRRVDVLEGTLQQESACPVFRLLKRKQSDSMSHWESRHEKRTALNAASSRERFFENHQMQWQVILERMKGQWTDLLNLCHSCKKIKTRLD